MRPKWLHWVLTTPRESCRGSQEVGMVSLALIDWCLNHSWNCNRTKPQKSDTFIMKCHVFMFSIATPVSVSIPLFIFCWLGFMCPGNPWKGFWFFFGFVFQDKYIKAAVSKASYFLYRNKNIFFGLLVTFCDLLCIQPDSVLLASLEKDKLLCHYLSENNNAFCFFLSNNAYLMRRERLNEDIGHNLRVWTVWIHNW